MLNGIRREIIDNDPSENRLKPPTLTLLMPVERKSGRPLILSRLKEHLLD